MSGLAERLARRIATTGPLTVAEYMAAALGDPTHGYYRRADPLDPAPVGAEGDFTTAPEISQLFGELIGAWLIDCWEKIGRPKPVRLVELGPGNGTLMADALRVARLSPAWLDAVDLHLVEINPGLARRQAERLLAYRPCWHESLATVPEGPLLLVANEFFDALPIRQFVFKKEHWRERLIGWSADAGFHHAPAQAANPLAMLIPAELPAVDGAVFELSPAVIGVTGEIARRIRAEGGAALIIDYGRERSATGESLQAVRRHRMVDALENPGAADLSAHVDFGAVARAAREAGTVPFGPAPQGEFLQALGIGERAKRLKANASAGQMAVIDAGLDRLTGETAMGRLFKALAIVRDIVPAGFAGT